jgi:hypothetical protein
VVTWENATSGLNDALLEWLLSKADEDVRALADRVIARFGREQTAQQAVDAIVVASHAGVGSRSSANVIEEFRQSCCDVLGESSPVR